MRLTQRIGILALVTFALFVPGNRHGSLSAQGTTFNYAEALQKALFFYEVQISGQKPPWSRVTWRGNSAMQDGADVGLDLTGGWFDAGDHVKFGFAMASSATMLAWAGVEYRPAFESKGQLPHLLNNLRVATDYFIKAHTAPNELWGQVGDGNSDHAFWGAAEIMHLRTNRPSFKIDLGCGGSDLAAETAAAMAASSLVFRPTDAAYANTLVSHARQLFAFAEATHPSFYVNCIPAPFYDSRFGNPNDEMTWAAVWLFRATGETNFLTRARALYPTMCKENGTTTPCFTWTQSWNDKHFGTYVLLAKLTGEQQFHTDAQRWLDYWSVGTGRTTRTTAGGLMFVHNFASIRYATNTAFIALVYADTLGGTNALFPRYHNFAKQQVDYALGANPRNSSYMVGFGNNPPRNPHHRTAHGTWVNSVDGEPAINRHILYGGLVGGPDAQDDNAWSDSRGQFMRTEVATDFNAGLTGALARLAQEFGGNPLASFPPIETPDDELFVEAQINVAGQNFTEIRAWVSNRSAWPARILNQGTFRYYFTLEPGVTPSQVTLNSNFNQCGQNNVSGPTQFSGSVYFVTVSCVGTQIYPGGQENFRKEVQFRIAVPANVPGNWDPTNDYSFQGLTASAPARTRNIVLLDNGVRVWGNEPGPPVADFSLAANPSSVPVVRGSTATSTIGIARVNGFTAGVTLTASTLPTGVTATFSPNPATGASSIVTFAASATAALGSVPVTISGAGGGLTRTAPITLTISQAQTSDFSLAANPNALTVARGASGASTITITRIGGFTGSVGFLASGLPSGVTATFAPVSTAGTTSTLTLAASATATLGQATVTVTGTSGNLTHTTPVALTVTTSGGSGDGGVTITPVVNANGPWFNEEALRVNNTAAITAMSMSIVIQRTTGVSFNGQYNTVGSQIAQSNTSTTSTITYQFSLVSGQTLSPGSNRLFAAQMSGTGTVHPMAGDTFTVTYTVGGVTFTQSGHF
jgi:hypothetical protein